MHQQYIKNSFNQIFETTLDNFIITYFDNILIYSTIKKNISNMSSAFSKNYKNMTYNLN